MKTFENQIAQGDILIMRVPSIPKTAKRRAPSKDKRIIVAHSETGHHHYLAALGVEAFDVENDPFTCYLAIAQDGCELVHARPYDTHETISFGKGNYVVRRQREHAPEGFRMVQD